MKVYELSIETETSNLEEEPMLFSSYQKARQKADEECDHFRRNLQYNWRLDEDGTGDDVRLFDWSEEFENRAFKYRRNVGIHGCEQDLEWMEIWIVEKEVL